MEMANKKLRRRRGCSYDTVAAAAAAAAVPPPSLFWLFRGGRTPSMQYEELVKIKCVRAQKTYTSAVPQRATHR